MAAINPTKIAGRWREGFTLDLHTLDSTFIGYNEFGHPMFENEYSEVGALLYRLKNKHDDSVVEELADTVARFVRSWNQEIQLVVPVPPTRQRAKQPVFLVGAALSEKLGVPFKNCVAAVKKISELKNVSEYSERVKLLKDAHTVEQSVVEGRKVLLFDDLFRSGATLSAVTDVLYDRGRAAEVYAVTLTRTRVKS